MKLTVEREALAGALQAVNARSLGRMNIPILQCVLLYAMEHRLRVFAHWLDACCSFEIPAEVSGVGRLAVDAGKLAGLVNGFGKGHQVTLATVADGLEIKSGRARYRLPALPAAEYPEPLTEEGAVKFSIPAEDFLSLLGPPEVAMDHSVTRRYLNGIFLHAMDGRLASCATDGHNLVRVQTELKVPEFEPIILPRERISDLRADVKKGDVALECAPRLFTVTAGERRYTTKLIDGTFPDYRRVIPAERPSSIIVTRDDFLAALHRLIVLLGDHNTITLSWDAGARTMALHPHRGADGADETIEADGGEIDAGDFTTPASRLAALMSVIPYDEVRLTFTDRSSPLRIEGVSSSEVLQLVMPTDFGKPAAAAA